MQRASIQVSRQLFHYARRQGHLGPLVFVWALGIAVFVLLPGSALVFGVLSTIVVLALGFGKMRSYLGDRQIREQLLHSA